MEVSIYVEKSVMIVFCLDSQVAFWEKGKGILFYFISRK